MHRRIGYILVQAFYLTVFSILGDFREVMRQIQGRTHRALEILGFAHGLSLIACYFAE